MIGEQIKQLRLAKGWSKYRLAKELECHWDTIKRWERGDHKPDVHSLKKLNETLGLELVDKSSI
jgi:ribosome-binding protein aMBF1 (putative translation factor)